MARVTKTARQALLELLAEGWTAEKAMESLPHHRSAWFRIRTRDPEFADAWDAAVEQGHVVLGNVIRDELRRRAVDGVEEPVFYQGEVVGHVRKFSDQLLLAMANNLLPEYDHPSRVEHTGPGGTPLEIRFAFDPGIPAPAQPELAEVRALPRAADDGS